jgi:hypothetical protein
MFSTNASQVSTAANYIEDVFSTYLYTGNGSTQTITNGIDLSTKGGLVWIKDRSAGFGHNLQSSPGTGFANSLISNGTNYDAVSDAVTAFNVNGFSLGNGSTYGRTNTNSNTYVSWSFREQPKFFDIVAYTGNGSSARAISHNLGSVPGAIIVKRLTSGYDWAVYHRSLTNINKQLVLNTDAGEAATSNWAGTTPTSTEFTVSGNSEVNTNGAQYVAYLFAHNAGGFGLTGNDNVISCGSYTGNGSTTGPVINLGYEPQWLLVKNASNVAGWQLMDVMRGMPLSGGVQALYANLSDAELNTTSRAVIPTATGFQPINTSGIINTSGETYIYIAIRRGPMKVPTSGTSVYYGSTVAINTQMSVGFNPDLFIGGARGGAGQTQITFDRLRGAGRISTALTNAEADSGTNNFTSGPSNTFTQNQQGGSRVNWLFGRAPGFFDEVCYTGTGADQTVAHNLGVIPELIIVKCRSNASTDWLVKPEVNTAKYLSLNLTDAIQGPSTAIWSSSNQTASNFYVGVSAATGASGRTFVAYLFATCPGVSKVGSYTGTGATQTIDCGFTGGARFVLIKRTDTTGDWYVWDTSRGMVSGTDPSLLLNTGDAEVNANSVYTTGVGFQIVSTAAGINASGGTYIFLAIA